MKITVQPYSAEDGQMGEGIVICGEGELVSNPFQKELGDDNPCAIRQFVETAETVIADSAIVSIDLSKVTAIDDSGLAALTRVLYLSSASEKAGKIALWASTAVARTLSVTGLGKVFDVTETEDPEVLPDVIEAEGVEELPVAA